MHFVAFTNELHSYAVHKAFFFARENTTQSYLINVTLWLIGQYGEHLTSGNAIGPENNKIIITIEEIFEFIEDIFEIYKNKLVTLRFAINCVGKLIPNYRSSHKEKLLYLLE